MLITEIKGISFRNLEDFKIIPHEKMNVIYGENAQGKTNLIESIWLFTGAKSFRTNKDSQLTRIGKEKSRLTIEFLKERTKNNASITIGERRKAVLNEKNLSSPSLLVGNFCAVVFSPDDLSLVSGSPEKRRRFLDVAISQLYPKYLETLKRYNRALAQRNYLLKEIKEKKGDINTLCVFERELALSGKMVIKYRERYIERILPIMEEIFEGLSSNREKIEINYIKTAQEENLEEKLIEKRNEDISFGFTSVGPHRDDIDFLLNGLSVKNFGSQGQKRSVSLSLKLSEAEFLEEITGEYPVVLLDDVLSELDKGRQNYILNHIKKMQVFLTCCDKSDIENLSEGKIFYVKDGKIEEKE